MGEKDYVKIPCGEYFVGLDPAIIKNLENIQLPFESKIEYLENSVPRHGITLRNVSISRRLVSLQEFEVFALETGYLSEAEKEGWGWTWRDGWVKVEGLNWRFPFGDRTDKIYRENSHILPVLQVSCNDAREYCGWLSGRMDGSVRLPGEAEWEVFAEIMGSEPLERLIFSFFTGSEPPKKELPVNGHSSGSPETGQYTSNLEMINTIIQSAAAGHSHPIGLLWEWTDDWFDAYPGGRQNKEFGRVYKVLRGGSLLSHPIQKSREYRFRRCPTARSPFYGFRVAVE